MSYFGKYENAIAKALARTRFSSQREEYSDSDSGLQKWESLTSETRQSDGTIYFIGNGASASMASHMSLDVTKNGGIKSLAFNDSAFLTAISNDLAYDEVFSLCIEKFGSPEDMLIAISSSGNSRNIARGIEAAKDIGMSVITLTGMNSDNTAKQLGDLNIYVPAKTYGIVECCHQILVHCWLDRLMGIEPE